MEHDVVRSEMQCPIPGGQVPLHDSNRLMLGICHRDVMQPSPQQKEYVYCMPTYALANSKRNPLQRRDLLA